MNEIHLKKVYVIVPVYNVEKFIEKNILSLINQSYKNLEIILVNDGSTDKSGFICNQYAELDSRIQVIHKKNEGVSEARNIGIENATGEYIVFVEGDDWLEENAVDYYIKLIIQTNSDMAVCVNNFTTRDRVQVQSDKIEIYSSDKMAAQFLYPGITIGCWNKIYKTEFLLKNNLRFTMKYSGEGMHFIVTVVQKTNQIGVGHLKVYNYRLNNTDSAMTKYDVKMGIYAQKSIQTIKDEVIFKTPILINAINYHIWKNYGYTLFLIIATNSKKENKDLFNYCRKNLVINLTKVLIKSNVSVYVKIKMIFQTFFPVIWAKRRLKKSKIALEKDLNENLNNLTQ